MNALSKSKFHSFPNNKKSFIRIHSDSLYMYACVYYIHILVYKEIWKKWCKQRKYGGRHAGTPTHIHISV